MIIGIPREIKDNEYRVALTPSGARDLVSQGRQVLIEEGAGVGSGLADEEYRRAGALLLRDKKELFARADLIIKVKEPLPDEYPLFRRGQLLFTFLHLAANLPLAGMLLEKGVTAIGYETIETPDKKLPLLKPMSEIAGKLSVQIGAHYLQRNKEGRGVLLAGVPGVPRGDVTVLGGGTVGFNAAKIALGMGARVQVLDINPERLHFLENILGGGINTLYSNRQNIEEAVTNSDLLIGAVLLPGGRQAPHVVGGELVSRMREGAVIVDVAIDQGGCIATSRPTSHSEPVYARHGVIHYCVCNIPGIVSRTSTLALTNLTLPYILKIAGLGLSRAVAGDPSLAAGVNLFQGEVTCSGVAESLDLPCAPLSSLLKKAA